MEIKSVACRKSFTDALVELGKKDKNIVPEIGRNININQRKDKKGTRSYTKKGR